MAAKKKIQTEVPASAPDKISSEMFYGMRLDEQQLAFANAIWNKDIDIVFCNAKAGTGKTTIATGVADMLVKYGMFDSIVYIMSPYGERKQGWLPGTITEKSSVYFEAFYQAMENCNINFHTSVNTDSMVNQKNGTGYITCITDTFLRGTNLNKAVVILDEAQNYTSPQLKKILTRVCDGTKVVVIGHDLQCDLDASSKSGFVDCINHFDGCDRAFVCKLTQNYRGWISRHADELSD